MSRKTEKDKNTQPIFGEMGQDLGRIVDNIITKTVGLGKMPTRSSDMEEYERFLWRRIYEVGEVYSHTNYQLKEDQTELNGVERTYLGNMLFVFSVMNGQTPVTVIRNSHFEDRTMNSVKDAYMLIPKPIDKRLNSVSKGLIHLLGSGAYNIMIDFVGSDSTIVERFSQPITYNMALGYGSVQNSALDVVKYCKKNYKLKINKESENYYVGFLEDVLAKNPSYDLNYRSPRAKKHPYRDFHFMVDAVLALSLLRGDDSVINEAAIELFQNPKNLFRYAQGKQRQNYDL